MLSKAARQSLEHFPALRGDADALGDAGDTLGDTLGDAGAAEAGADVFFRAGPPSASSVFRFLEFGELGGDLSVAFCSCTLFFGAKKELIILSLCVCKAQILLKGFWRQLKFPETVCAFAQRQSQKDTTLEER